MRISLKQKIVTTSIMLVLVIAVTCAVFLKTIIYNALENEIDKRAMAIARHFAELSADASLNDSTSLLHTQIRDSISTESYLAYIVVLGANREVQAHSFSSRPPNDIMSRILERGTDKTSYYYLTTDGKQIEDFYIPVGTGSNGSVHIGIYEDKISHEVNELLNRLAPALIFLLAIGGLAAFILASIITRHLGVLMEGVSRVTRGDLDVVIKVHSHDEIGECAAAFNQMTENLRSTTVSREFMKKLINTMNDVLVVISPDGIIKSVNQAFCTLFGYTETEIVGRRISEFEEQDAPLCMYSAFEHALQDGRVHGIESCCRTKGGELIPMLFSLAVMKDDEEKPVAIICAAQDISNLKRVQDALWKKQAELEEVNRNLEDTVASRTAELAITNEGLRAEVNERKKNTEELRTARDTAESANRAKSEFLANMSHEMRTPLNSIIGVTEYLDGTELDDNQKKCLLMVRQSGESLLLLVSDLIDLSRIEAGHLEIISQEFNLQDTLEHVIGMFSEEARTRQLDISLTTSPNLPHFVVGDRIRLQQVLINLISNAVKFSDAQGQVVLSALTGRGTEGSVAITFIVRDSGIGIDPSKLEMIFESFTQADASITRQYGGSGLGLAISRRLVEAMGGQLHVQSAPGSGSSFSFTLTFNLASPSPERRTLADRDTEAPLTSSESPGHLPRVLLVDDSVENRDLIRLLLSRFNLLLDEANHGREAVRMFEEKPYDLILMDIQMPLMDGYSATRMIREIERQYGRERIPVIALTAHAYESDIRKCLEAGCDDHIAKPFKKKTLADCMTRYLKELNHG